MNGPQRFVEWMSAHEHKDRLLGYVYKYHSRSDAHSKALCKFIMDDLLERCPALYEQVKRQHIVVWETNVRFTFPQTGKQKTLDLAIGPPAAGPIGVPVPLLADIFVACEAKTVMTEHGKSQPRIFDELSSSHEIVHQGNPKAIAAGITVVNIAETFVSPLRQRQDQTDLVVSRHKQPEVTERMVNHLRGLLIRDDVGQVGFDAYATIVIRCDNQGPALLCTTLPAPQPGDRDHYETFITRIAKFYAERFS
jgi:hypothetical protein